MKAILLLLGFGLFLLVGTVGCEEDHEHFHHEGRGGAYEGNYYGHGYGAYPYQDEHGYRHD